MPWLLQGLTFIPAILSKTPAKTLGPSGQASSLRSVRTVERCFPAQSMVRAGESLVPADNCVQISGLKPRPKFYSLFEAKNRRKHSLTSRHSALLPFKNER
jgi:hypothetical protein